ncbi:M28 family metallopeptidase [Colwelliaceae bacterium 6441]
MSNFIVNHSLATLLIFIMLISHCAYANAQDNLVNQIHREVVAQDIGIGAREAGSKAEKNTAKYIIKSFNNMGLNVTEQDFSFGKKDLKSKNIIADTNPLLKKTIVLGAHYDSTAAKTGSLGATDNGAGLAAMLAIAHSLSSNTTLSYNIRFIAFGAEEVGLQGSKYYIKQLASKPEKLDEIVAMINFDTIAGGDFVYVHSAHTTPYRCDIENPTYNSNTQTRQALLNASKHVLGEKEQYVIHPKYKGYPEGVTGSWSDHAPFACAGIPIAYVESTNFTINGKAGFDGYSQSVHPALWDCYDAKNNTACDRQTEKKWGNIWHSQFDRIDKLSQLFPNRIEKQISNNVKVLIELLSNFDQYNQPSH